MARAIPILDAEGNITEWFGASSDITARKQAEQALTGSEARYRQLAAELEQLVQQRTSQLQNSIGDLQRSNENMEQFAYVASHDLQEPLRKIQQFGDLLQGQYGNALADVVSTCNACNRLPAECRC